MATYRSRLNRTLEDLAEFNSDIKYRPGNQNQAADFLSRLEQPISETYNNATDDNSYKALPKVSY